MTENFQMPWKPFLSVESDRFTLWNSFLTIWKRLWIVRTTFEKNWYQRGDHWAWYQILWSPLPLTEDFQMPWQPFLSVESDSLKFRNSFLIIWKRLGIVRTTLKKIYTKGGTTRPDFKSFGPPVHLTENFQMPWKTFLSVERDRLTLRNSFLIIWKRLGIVRTTLKKIDTKGGTTRPDFKSFGPTLHLTDNFQMPWKPFLSVESDRFTLRNSFFIIWKRLGVVRTTFEKNRYQRWDHRAWFQILWSPHAFDRKFSNALTAVFISWKWFA